METITGKIQKLWEKPTKGGKSMYFIEIEGEVYSGFEAVPDSVNDAFQAGEPVCFEFEFKGKYRNIHAIKTKPSQPPLNNFKNGGQLNVTDRIMGEIAGNMGKCHTATAEILGRPPKTDGEMAMQNSMFIELNKQLPRK